MATRLRRRTGRAAAILSVQRQYHLQRRDRIRARGRGLRCRRQAAWDGGDRASLCRFQDFALYQLPRAGHRFGADRLAQSASRADAFLQRPPAGTRQRPDTDDLEGARDQYLWADCRGFELPVSNKPGS
jgi:hypothetical protein